MYMHMHKHRILSEVFMCCWWCSVGGASVSEVGERGLSLLLQAIQRKDTESALFLLNNGADPSAR